MTSIAPVNGSLNTPGITPISAPRDSTTFAETLPDSPDALEVVMREERRQLKASIEELGSAMREKVDVRARFRENPLAVAGAGFAAGLIFGVISGRSKSNEADTLSPSLSEKINHKPSAGSNRSPGTFGKFAAAVTGMVGMRVADLAEDTIRDSLANSRFSMPDRKSAK